jgi:hypothetical protein
LITFKTRQNIVVPMRDTAVADLDELPGSWVQGWKGRAPRWTSQPFEGRSAFERRIIADLQRDGRRNETVHIYERAGHWLRNQAGELLT